MLVHSQEFGLRGLIRYRPKNWVSLTFYYLQTVKIHRFKTPLKQYIVIYRLIINRKHKEDTRVYDTRIVDYPESCLVT